MRSNFLKNLYPITKIALIFSFGISAVIAPVNIGIIELIILCIVGIIGGLKKDVLKILICFGIPVTLMLIFIQGIYSPKNRTILYSIGSVKLYREGTMYAIHIICCILIFVLSFYVMNKTTETSELVVALSKIGMSSKGSYLVLASLNVVPQMQRRLSIIKDAQASRGVNLNGNILTRLKAYVPLLGPVIMSSLTDAQERGMTLETRGFGAGCKPTYYICVNPNLRDYIITLLLIIYLIVIIALKLLKLM